ncbi:putative bifunctional diguanylate cyclase/phosphodiesterase [Cohnella sp. GCM10027633]|uniref:putative bifunctional diguanylate cyclase/phosphodiesterase n=1 Tax=unclassified Cohnella TaxID=2636738 RepID=UPI0036350866
MDASRLMDLLPGMTNEMEDSIYIMEADRGQFRYVFVNRAATRLSGIAMDAAGKTFFEANTPEMAAYLQPKYTRVVQERRTIRFEDGVVLPNGIVSGESILNPIYGDDGEVQYVVCITRDTTERRGYEDKLLHFAYRDDLTQLYNRRYLFENIANLESIYLFDLDYFKKINDTFGHGAGDAVLVEVASRMERAFERDHLLVRLGGDEFVVAKSGGELTPEEVVARIKGMFDDTFRVHDRQVKLSASIGVALRRRDEDAYTLLKQADIALYRAKGNGRKTHHVYELDMKYEHVENFIHELELSNALERGELGLVYQPIYNYQFKRIIGTEALLRWNRGGADFIPPADFIPIAEETGLIIPIGYWVIHEACKFWQRFGSSFGEPFKLSINISSVQLNDADFVDNLLLILKREGISPRVFELEITERTVIHNVASVRQTLGRLRKAGFTVALDDFGTGYSSLNMLTSLPLDKLKIDKSFIRDSNVPFITSILMMANALKLEVIVEGVEDESQFRMLSSMNCWGLQGYYISMPLGHEQIAATIERRDWRERLSPYS